MNVLRHVAEPVDSLLDVGCNAGIWLRDCSNRWPRARLAGIDINQSSLEKARALLASVEIRCAGAENIPFPDQSFDYVTCLEVLEHLPPELRSQAFVEMWRVLRPAGRLIMTVPHDGWFAWMDSNNVRHRFPWIYKRLVGRGKRDGNYEKMSRMVEWHHHFNLKELEILAGERWKVAAVERGGLFLYPLMDWFSWPFYRMGIPSHPIRRTFEIIAGWDYCIDFGSASYGVLIVFEKKDLHNKTKLSSV